MSDSKGAAIDAELGEILKRYKYDAIYPEKYRSPKTLNFIQAKQAILAILAQEVNKARIDELHNIGASMLTDKGLAWIMARNQELKADLERLG